MIFSIFGYGKFKTEASLGMVVRAVSNHEKILVIQFLKKDNTGEASFLKQQFNVDYFTTKSELKLTEEDKKRCNNLLIYAHENMKEYDLIVLDESLIALDYNYLSMELFDKFIKKAKKNDKDVCLTGRIYSKSLRTKIIDISDIASNNHCEKHAFNSYCNSCKKDYQYYFKFCPICGRKLNQPKEAKRGRDY